MMPSRRQWFMAGFLTAFALGIWFISFVPGAPFVPAALELGWLAVAIFAAWKLSPDPVPAVRTPELTIPEAFLTTDATTSSTDVTPVNAEPTEPSEVGAEVESESVEELAEELVEELVEEPVEELGEASEAPATVDKVDWEPVLALLESLEQDWSKPDLIGPGLAEVTGNSAFILANVQQSYNIADNLAGSAQRAFSLSEKVQKGVVIVTDALVESLKQTEVLSEHSQRIVGILQLMGEVSDKIHVLSINASIVSARAGAAGRGFEVVAKEIRSLAKETEHSLGDIVEVIELLRSSIAKVIEVVRDADLETEQEKSSLIEVAGALQGVILGVEIVKAVSGFAKEKGEEQEKLFQTLSSAERGPGVDVKSKAAAVRARLEEWKSKE